MFENINRAFSLVLGYAIDRHDTLEHRYDPDSSEPWTAYLKVEPNSQYKFTYDILNSDLASTSEHLDSITVDGLTFSGCADTSPWPGDYDCTFKSCGSSGSEVVESDENGLIRVDSTYKGNSYDCDCNHAEVSGSCVMENTGTGNSIWTPTKAGIRFVLTKVMSSYVVFERGVREYFSLCLKILLPGKP